MQCTAHVTEVAIPKASQLILYPIAAKVRKLYFIAIMLQIFETVYLNSRKWVTLHSVIGKRAGT